MPREDRAQAKLAMTMAEERQVDFGTFLRLAREQRGVSLQDLAVTTKISTRVLEALERNDPSKLPGGIFSRAFVRTYAQEVGLDPEMVVARFVLAFPDESGADDMPAATGAVEAETFELRRRALRIAVRLLGVALLVALIAFLYLSRVGPRSDATLPGEDLTSASETVSRTPALPATQPAAPEPVATSVVPEVTRANGAQEGAAAAGAAATDGAALPPADAALPTERPAASGLVESEAAPDAPLVVVLTFTDPCWLAVSVDGTRRPSRTASAGERLEFSVTRSMTMTLGNAGAVSVTLNGQPVPALGAAGQAVTRTIPASGYERLLR